MNKTKAIVVLYNGPVVSPATVTDIAFAISNGAGVDIEDMSITVMDEKEMAKSVAYLLNSKKALNNARKVLESEELDPLAAALTYVGGLIMRSNGYVDFVTNIVAKAADKESKSNIELENAIEIIATANISSNYLPLMKKYGFTDVHIESIKKVYNMFYVSQ